MGVAPRVSAVYRRQLPAGGRNLDLALAREPISLGLPAPGLGSAAPRRAPPPRLRHPRGQAADDDTDEEHAEEVGVEGQDQEQDRLVGAERVEHPAWFGGEWVGVVV